MYKFFLDISHIYDKQIPSCRTVDESSDLSCFLIFDDTPMCVNNIIISSSFIEVSNIVEDFPTLRDLSDIFSFHPKSDTTLHICPLCLRVICKLSPIIPLQFNQLISEQYSVGEVN